MLRYVIFGMDMFTRSAPLRRFVLGLTAVALLGFALVAPPASADTAPLNPANPATPPTVSVDPLPSIQIDGVVWSQVVVGNIVYAAGDFDFVRPPGSPPGQNTTPRQNLLAYDIRTGALVTTWAPTLNAQGKSITASPDGSRIYVAGTFTVANGQPRYRLAAFSATTGALVPGFNGAGAPGAINAVAATNSAVYIGGNWTDIGGVPRQRVAAFNAATGALLPFAATINYRVNAMVLTTGGTQLVIGGSFATVNGATSRSVAALDATTGASRPFAISALLNNTGDTAAVLSLTTDGDTVYGTGYTYGPGNFEGVFAANAAGGGVRWVADCLGDHYSTFSDGAVVYSSSHAHSCSAMRAFPEPPSPRHWHYATAFSKAATTTNTGGRFPGQPAPNMQAWDPSFVAGNFTKQYQAGWSIVGNADYVAYGGEFLSVNGTSQQGIVRFARTGLAPNLVGPRAIADIGGTPSLTPTLSSPFPGTVRVAWRTTADPDNENLIYRIVRNNVAVHERTVASKFWTLSNQTFDNTGMPGGTYNYQVVAIDPFGNQRASEVRTITIAGVPNSPPTASFTFSTNDLTASFDGSGSSDPGGSIAAYTWDFGDSTAGTGVTTSHVYAVAGTYTVRLTVTDNFGATGTTTRSVTVTRPPGAAIASDSFTRTVTGGLGSADVGGPYTLSGGASNFSVNGASCQLRNTAGATLLASLNSVSTRDAAVQVSMALDRAPAAASAYLSVLARKVGNDEYRARARVFPDGTVSLTLQKKIGSTYTTLQAVNLPGLIYTAGAVLNIRLQVSGSGTTTLEAKAWLSTAAEPAGFQVSATDTASSLQGPGGVGFETYVSASVTNAPITTSVDNLWVGASGTAP